ncbi:MAG: CBS domain-containing protein, partial [Myxococcales bacterium]|nr:CBS domain-containing protein [Myxococcales bacterium]
MTPRPCLIDETLSVADARDRMQANNIHHLVVVSHGRAVGVVDAADLDLAAELSPHAPHEIGLAKAKRPLYTCAMDTPLAAVVEVMEAQRHGCAVVVDGGHVIGIFTATDALRALRQLVRGHPVDPQVVPTHRPVVPAEREHVPSRVRTRQVVNARGATPSAS